MCSNYQPVTSEDRLLTFFGVDKDPAKQVQTPAEVWPLYLAPFIRLAEDGSGNRIIEHGQFGMMLPFRAELAYGRKTYNARTETVDQLITFKSAWANGQRCVIPAEAIYEPCFESGQAVSWRIHRPGGVPMGIAGVYRMGITKAGEKIWSFAMLTVNAAGHPVFQRMHRPQDEKRMLLILDEEDYSDWLTCSEPKARIYWRQWDGALDSEAAPLPPRQRSPKGAKAPTPKMAKEKPAKAPRELPRPSDPGSGDLF